MSYDYDATVSSIQYHRREASSMKADPTIRLDQLQKSVELFADFSTQCPMTPLLWMQYAQDAGDVIEGLLASQQEEQEQEEGTTAMEVEEQVAAAEVVSGATVEATKEGEGDDADVKKETTPIGTEARRKGLETRIDTLSLAIDEFPGCAVLRLRLCDALVKLAALGRPPPPDEEDGAEEDAERYENLDGTVRSAFDDALNAVGRGSHRNEDDVVSALYRKYASYLADCGGASKSDGGAGSNGDAAAVGPAMPSPSSSNKDDVASVLVRRARTPMKSANDALTDELHKFLERDHPDLSPCVDAETLDLIEEGRRYASRVFAPFVGCEEDVDEAMETEGILRPMTTNHDHGGGGSEEGKHGDDDDDEGAPDWNALLEPPHEDLLPGGGGEDAPHPQQHRCLMGLGGQRTADAFLRYVRALSNYGSDEARRQKRRRHRHGRDAAEPPHDDEDEDEDEEEVERRELERTFASLALPVYERGVSECPTVEALWVSYVRHLFKLVGSPEADEEMQRRQRHRDLLKSACRRSVRNCPYSARLFDLKMRSIDLLASASSPADVFEPDDVLAVAREAIEGKFLPNRGAHLQVYLSAIGTVKRRILSIVSRATSPVTPAGELIGEEIAAVGTDYDGVDVTTKAGKTNKRQAGENDPGSSMASAGRKRYRNLDPDDGQDVRDLVEDLREMYDAADSHLRKAHGDWTVGRAALWYDRAYAEAFLLSPLIRSLEDNDDEEDEEADGPNSSGGGSGEAVRCFEKLVRVHQPPHPDSWRGYVRLEMGNHCASRKNRAPGRVLGALRRVRGLYRRALVSVRKQRERRPDEVDAETMAEAASIGVRDHDAALYDLCHDYLEFERKFGSEESLAQADKSVRGKIRDWGQGLSTPQAREEVVSIAGTGGAANAPVISTHRDTEQEGPLQPAVSGKRKVAEAGGAEEGNGETELSRKRAKIAFDVQADKDEEVGQGMEKSEKKINLKVPKPHPEHRIHVGKLDYPAHPFTVHVKNLSSQTEDMDLVDTFGPKCGAVVHAKILREKHHPRFAKGKSKCAGLIQFEERDSVEKALELDGVLGLHDKLIKVERSHVPAVGIVPPGMHRVSAKGEGRSSRRNQKRKETKDAATREKDGVEVTKGKEANSIDSRSAEGKEGAQTKNPYLASDSTGSRLPAKSALVFRPRGLHGQKHHKVKVEVGDKKGDK